MGGQRADWSFYVRETRHIKIYRKEGIAIGRHKAGVWGPE